MERRIFNDEQLKKLKELGADYAGCFTQVGRDEAFPCDHCLVLRRKDVAGKKFWQTRSIFLRVKAEKDIFLTIAAVTVI